MLDRCDHGWRRSSTLERSMRAKQGCSEAKPDLCGLSRLSFRRPFGVAGRQARLDPGRFPLQERSDFPLTQFAQSAFDRRNGKRTDHPTVCSTNGDAEAPRAGEQHARIQSVTLRPGFADELAQYHGACRDSSRPRPPRSPPGLARVRGPATLPTGRGSRRQFPGGDGPPHAAHGSGSGTALLRDERRWSRRPAAPTGRPCRPFPGSTVRGTGATSDGCRSACLRGYPGRRSPDRGGSAGFPVLIEKTCAHQCEEHAAYGRLRQTALLDKIGQSGPRRPGPADEQQEGGRTVDRLGSTSDRVTNRLDRYPGRCALWMFQHMDLLASLGARNARGKYLRLTACTIKKFSVQQIEANGPEIQ